YTADTLQGLLSLPLIAAGSMPGRPVLMLHRPNIPTKPELVAAMRASGAALDEDTFDDYPALLRDTDRSIYPDVGFGKLVSWLAPLRGDDAATLRLPGGAGDLSLPECIETPAYLPSPPELFGILSKPRQPTRAPAVVFLNTGANHHVGTSRMTVTMSRRLA